jgi:hypothetical protein
MAIMQHEFYSISIIQANLPKQVQKQKVLSLLMYLILPNVVCENLFELKYDASKIMAFKIKTTASNNNKKRKIKVKFSITEKDNEESSMQ